MDKCVIKPRVKNLENKYVDSELFSSLLHYTNNRDITKLYYAVGTSPEFLSKVSDRAVFDSNGEITFESLKKITKMDLLEETTKLILNKDLGSGIYDYNEAIPKLLSFNKSSPFNDDYLATIIDKPDGKVELVVVKNNKTNRLLLEDNIANRNLQDRIKFYLNKAGADYSFLENSEKINGKYSTINASKTIDNLYLLIKVANNELIEESLSEEAGHFAVGALGRNPLVIRLESLLTPEVQKSIMGDKYNDIAYLKNPSREVAGYLVGKAINRSIDKESSYKLLLDRIINAIKRVFNNITNNEIANSKLEAKKIANSIAKGFMSHNFLGTVELALETKETLYSALDSNNVKVFKRISDNLKLLVQEMKALNNDAWKKYHNIEEAITIGRTSEKPSIFADNIALEGISDAVDLIADTIPEMIERLNSINFESENITTENANKIREVRIFVRNSVTILKIIEDATSTNSLDKLNTPNEFVIEKLNKLSSELHNAIAGYDRLLSNLELIEKKFFAKFLEGILRAKQVHLSATKIFNWKGSLKGEPLIKPIQAMDIKVSDLINQLDSDITHFERFLASMSNNSDLVGLLYDRAIKEANTYANLITLTFQDKLRALFNKASNLGIQDTKYLCEISLKDGKLTGNIVSKYVRGDWENEWLEFKNNAIKEFKESAPLDNKSDSEKSILFADFFKPRAKSWHKLHSQFNKVTDTWDPNDSYLSELYKNLSKDLLSILNEFMGIKGEIEVLLNGNGVTYRMPQFKGTTTNKIKNKKLFENSGSAILHTLRNNLADTFLEDCEDTLFGSLLTYNTINEDMFSNELLAEREKINRIPLYGINKLKDTSQLSTDLFLSTLAYAGMSSSYAAINSVVGSLELGMEVLKNRNVEGLRNEHNRKHTSKAYSRLSKFMENNVYNIHTPKLKIGKRLVVNKVSGFMSGIASKIFLGGNVIGGAANLTMGATEIFKESLAGEFFSVKDWEKAHINYWKDMPSNWIHAGDDVKEDKVSLFIRHFNILNDNDRKSKDWFTRKSKSVKLNPLGENLFMPYKVGEHYMLTMAFLAVANGTKLVDSSGNTISLYNAYEIVNIDDSNPKLGKTLALKEGVKKLNKETGELQDWNIEDDSLFMDKCREVNNRMHGIYNNLDKTAFQRTIFGAAFMAMKGYALGMIQRRLGANMHSITLNQNVEGSLRTAFKVLLSMRETPSLSLRALFLPMSKKVELEMLKEGYSPNQYRNMRRNFGDMLFIAISFLLKALFAKPEEEEEEEYTSAVMYYFASRLASELSAFNAPWGIIKESQALTNVLPAGVAVTIDLFNLAELSIGAITNDEDAFYKSSGATYEKGESKAMHKIERLLPFYRSYLLMLNPYQAAQSYQYGRVTGGAR